MLSRYHAMLIPMEKEGNAMSAAENTAVMRRLYIALNHGNLAVLDDHPGLADVKPTLQHACATAPDTQATIEELVAEGERVARRLPI